MQIADQISSPAFKQFFKNSALGISTLLLLIKLNTANSENQQYTLLIKMNYTLISSLNWSI